MPELLSASSARGRLFPCLPLYITPPSASFGEHYVHRLLNLSLMDMQCSMAQYMYVLWDVDKLYAFVHLRKRQKRYYARDDPSFVMILALFLWIIGFLFALLVSLQQNVASDGKAIQEKSNVEKETVVYYEWAGTDMFTVSLVPLLAFIVTGIFIPPCLYFILEKCKSRKNNDNVGLRFKKRNSGISVQGSRFSEFDNSQDYNNNNNNALENQVVLEAPYCFDVHANGFVWIAVYGFLLPTILQLIGTQIPLLHVLFCVLSNLSWSISIIGYLYVTFIGYNTLQVINNIQPFAAAGIFVCCFLAIITLNGVSFINWAFVSPSVSAFLQPQKDS